MSQNKRLYVWIAAGLLLLACLGLLAYAAGSRSINANATPTATPLPPPVVTIQGIKSQAKLATVEYTAVTEIYSENMPEGWLDNLLGRKEQLLMLVYGQVQAGFDLQTLPNDSLWTDGTRVRLVLPAPQILTTSIDFDRTHIVYYENNLLVEKNNPNLQGDALAQAKTALEQAAIEADVLNQAGQYAQTYFENFLYSLGFTEVEVVINAQIYKE
jgi:hypothetical protein